MKPKQRMVWLLLSFVSFAAVGSAPEARGQEKQAAQRPSIAVGAGTSVPRLVRFSGVLRDHLGNPLTGALGVTFALYKDPEGGAPLWLETQNVEADGQGRYAVLLGATSNEGLPVELFAAGEARWLGVSAAGGQRTEEQARVLLVSVPYALLAANAETLGGKPASAFLTTEPAAAGTGGGSTGKRSTSQANATTISPNAPVTTAGGTPNVLAKFDSTGTNLINSLLLDNGTNVGIGASFTAGTATPDSNLHIQGSNADVTFNFQVVG